MVKRGQGDSGNSRGGQEGSSWVGFNLGSTWLGCGPEGSRGLRQFKGGQEGSSWVGFKVGST